MSGNGQRGRPGEPGHGQQGGAGGAGGVGGFGLESGGRGGEGGPGGTGGTGKALQTGLKRLAILTITLYLLLASAIAVGWYYNRKTHDSLCKFDRSLADQVNSTNKFLADVKAGRRELPKGFTLADIKGPLVRQRATLHSLEGLGCDATLNIYSKEEK
jgi:hypothetical protein